MKEVGRSVHSGDVVKKRSSSGCLIIKKKAVDGVGGGKGFSDLASRNLFNSSKEKKRPRAIRSDSESSDEFADSYSRKTDRLHNNPIFGNRSYIESREFEAVKRVNNGFAIDEHDRFHERQIRKDVNDHGHGSKLHWRSGDQMESGSGSSKRIDDRRRDFVHDNRTTRPIHGIKTRYESDDNESHLPLPFSSGKYHGVSDKPIRLQGKNGVLKVMVNKYKQIGISHQTYDPTEADNRKEFKPAVLKKKPLNVSRKSHDHWEGIAIGRPGFMPEGANQERITMESSLYSRLKHPGKPIASKIEEKGETKVSKPMFVRNIKETDDTDASLPIKKPSSVRHSSTEKFVRSERSISPETKNVALVKGKEIKVKRGSGTEKQLLREKIRSMLLGAGWTIDYRPRRNRDYLDAVYINPSGTAYWSIIKAYEAFQKEGKDHSQVDGDFNPLPVETLSKLTRQTRKKIEREMKRRKEEGNDRNVNMSRMEVSAGGAETSKRRLEDSGDDSHDNYSSETDKQDGNAKKTLAFNSHMVQGQKSRKLGRCTLLVRREGKNSENGRFVPYSGKRTVLSWLIDSGTVQMGEKVQYMNRKKTRVMLEGWIIKDGIHCGCCSKILSIWKFELHAGSKLRQPFSNTFVQCGQSLMQCQIDAWNKQGELERKGFHTVDVEGDDPNDDTCGLCADGGDLICCDGCPSTFHQSCLGIQILPQGDWHCPNCSCKYCKTTSLNFTEASVRTPSPLRACCICEKKYHESCRLKMDEKPTDSTDTNLYFCNQKCLEIHGHLQKLIGVKHELDSGFSWSLIHRCDLSSDTSSPELSQRAECNSKLAVALSVIEECLLPVIDRRSRINIIHNVVYNCGSNFSRLNYSGFFTAVLEKGDEMISAASIRIHGTQLAEMPFIGTRHMYRRQGMCRRLFSAIESALSSLRIEKLIIPAISDHMHSWTGVFGFKPIEESHKQEMRSINMLVFPGTDMLQKPLFHRDTISKKGKITIETKNIMPKAEKSEPSSDFGEQVTSTDSDSSDLNLPLKNGYSVDSVKKDIPPPVFAKKDEVFCSSSTVRFNGDDTIMQNGEEGKQEIQSESIPTKKVEVFSSENPILPKEYEEGKESVSVTNDTLRLQI